MRQDAASYRDNDGFIFEHEGLYYRLVQPGYAEHYARLMQSGLYDELVSRGQLIAHKEIQDFAHPHIPAEGKVLLPEQVPFISYPYEWSFSQWKDAALLTLDIALKALEKDMILKDATPFNVQFMGCRPVFIDTLSFEGYREGEPWVAYNQFCKTLLGPLLLMQYCHPGTRSFFTVHPEGIPLDILVALLPRKARWNLQVYLHIYLQAKMSAKPGKTTAPTPAFSRKKIEVLLKSLHGLVSGLSAKKTKTAWDDYYTGTILGDDYLQHKSRLVNELLDDRHFSTVIDLGANDGHFTLLLKDRADLLVALDSDPNCIDSLYRGLQTAKTGNILPLVADLTAPSPAIGWNNAERKSLTERCRAGLVMALALVHHLAIGHNVPLAMIAGWLQPMAPLLLVEFVPKEDEKVQLLLRNREDIFEQYTLAGFKAAFEEHYTIQQEARVGNTGRILFLMKRK